MCGDTPQTRERDEFQCVVGDIRVTVAHEGNCALPQKIGMKNPGINLSKAKFTAWRNSLEKGVSLCHKGGHAGDAETLEDIVHFLNALVKK